MNPNETYRGLSALRGEIVFRINRYSAGKLAYDAKTKRNQIANQQSHSWCSYRDRAFLND